MGLLAQQSLSNSHKNNININFLTSSLLSWWLKWCSARNHSGCAPTSEVGVTPVHPRFGLTRPRTFPLPGISPARDARQLFVLNRVSNGQSEVSRYTVKGNTNCLNTNSILVQNNLTISDDRSQLLTWLSPLDPGLRHSDIQERRVKDVGEWLIQTEDFERWCGLGGEGEGDKGVLFCYGDPGVGKTFIR